MLSKLNMISRFLTGAAVSRGRGMHRGMIAGVILELLVTHFSSLLVPQLCCVADIRDADSSLLAGLYETCAASSFGRCIRTHTVKLNDCRHVRLRPVKPEYSMSSSMGRTC